MYVKRAKNRTASAAKVYRNIGHTVNAGKTRARVRQARIQDIRCVRVCRLAWPLVGV